jgi:hypothetical protein
MNANVAIHTMMIEATGIVFNGHTQDTGLSIYTHIHHKLAKRLLP